MEKCLLGGLISLLVVLSATVVSVASSSPWPPWDSDPLFVKTTLTEEDIPTLEVLKAQASDTTNPRHIAVFYMATDWCEVGNRLWNEIIKTGLPGFVVAPLDQPEVDTPISRLSRDNAHLGSFSIMGNAANRWHVYPAIGLFDAEGKLYAFFSGVEMPSTKADLVKRLTDAKERFFAYQTARAQAVALTDEQFQRAAEAHDLGMTWDAATLTAKDGRGVTITADIYRAALLANALILLEPNVYRLGFLWGNFSLVDDFLMIKAWDSEDVSGAFRRLTDDDCYSLAGKFVRFAKEENFSQGDRELAVAIDDRRLVKLGYNELQQRLLCGFILWRTKKRTVALEYVRRALDVNPNSFWGEAARGTLIMMGEGDITLTSGWSTFFTRNQSAEHPAFTWEIRYGTDRLIDKKGWYFLKMSVDSGAAVTVNSFEIDQDAVYDATTAAYLSGTKVFDGSLACHRVPTNGDTMGTFKEVTFPLTVTTAKETSISFFFYLPKDIVRSLPKPEKNNRADRPNSIRVKISGSSAGPSSGSFVIGPIIAP
ncbi:MAG: hypothetical protein RR133_03960 [Kiritimatiellia bacterium]